MNNTSYKLVITMFITMITTAAYTSLASSDTKQTLNPININANTFVLMEADGLAIYEGNVELTQGDIEITADKVEMHRLNGVDQIFAFGSPAYFTQEASSASEKIEAEAQKFEYSSASKQLHLLNNAKLLKQGALFEGDFIYYDTVSKSVSAESKQNKQILMILPNKNKSK